jgi:hypothetical protein
LDKALRTTPDKVRRASVLWAKADYGVELHTLEVLIEKMPPGKTWKKKAAKVEERLIAGLSTGARLLVQPLVARSTTWIDGRACEAIDFEGFYERQTVHMRTYLLPVGDHLLAVEWSFSNPAERANIDAKMREMFYLGPPLASPRAPTASEWDTHRLVMSKFALAMGSKALRDKAARLEGEFINLEQCVSFIHRKLNALPQTQLFFRGPTQSGGRAAARAAYPSAVEYLDNIVTLQTLYNADLIDQFRELLTPEERDKILSARPDLAEVLTTPRSQRGQ